MRVPFPERVSYSHAFLFGLGLGAVQLAEGTTPVIPLLILSFIMVCTTAFNLAGGMYYPSGAFIGINAVMTLLLPMVAKAILGEPVQRNLHSPVRTVEVYFCGSMAMLIGAVFTRDYRRKKSIIAGKLDPSQLRASYRGCLIFTFALSFLQSITYGGSGSLASFLNQINKFPALAYTLGVVAAVTFSKGRRSITWPLLGIMVWSASSGLLTFSKEAFLIPFFCWAVGAAYMRYKLKWVNLAAFAGGLYLTTVYMVPYAQIGRSLESTGRSSVEVSSYMLSHMDEVRRDYQENVLEQSAYHDYDQPITLLDRLDIVAIDDALVDITDHGKYFGYTPILYTFYNFIPHVFWPDKPRVFFGNIYGREVGVLGAEDSGTGVSFSFAADAYHEGGVFCLLLICPLLFMLVFVVLDSTIGDSRQNPVALVMTVLIFRAASEGNLTVMINLIQQPLIATLIISFIATYILPVIGRLVGAETLHADELTHLKGPLPVSSL